MPRFLLVIFPLLLGVGFIRYQYNEIQHLKTQNQATQRQNHALLQQMQKLDTINQELGEKLQTLNTENRQQQETYEKLIQTHQNWANEPVPNGIDRLFQ